MLIAQSISSGVADTQSISFLWLLLPSILAVASVVVSLLVYVRRVEWIDGVLSARRTSDAVSIGRPSGKRRRQAFRGVFLYALPVAMTILIGLVSLADLAEGLLGGEDVVMLSLAAVLVGPWAAAQLIESWHNDRWDERLADANDRIVQVKAEKDDVERERDGIVSLLRIIHGIVGLKADRVHEAAECQGTQDPLKRLLDALDPGKQIVQLVTSIHTFYRDKLDDRWDLRVAYFRRVANRVELVHCWNGESRGCINSPQKTYADRFAITPQNLRDCLAVAVAQFGEPVVIADAESADADPSQPFRFFDQQQRERIGSIIGLPLGNHDSPPPVDHLVTIDTNCKGFFSNSPMEKQERSRVLDAIGRRILFEADMERLCAPLESD